MHSFLNYFLDRQDGTITPFDEMAAPAVKFGKQEHEERRKAAIWIDQDDIDYLYQFPPSFWSQAMAYRYGPLLFKAAKAADQGRQIKDVQHVPLKYKGDIMFGNIDTRINHLHEKLTSDVDDEWFSRSGKSDEEKEHYRQQGGGHAGFSLKDAQMSKKHKGLGASEGYVAVTMQVAQKRLAHLIKSIDEGWFGEKPGDADHRLVTFGGGGKSDVWVHKPEEMSQLPGQGEKYGRDSEGRRIWYYHRKEKDKTVRKKRKEFLPVLKPAVMVDASSVRRHNSMMKQHKQIEANLDEHDFDLYLQAVNPSTRQMLEREISEIDAYLNRQGKSKEHDKETRQDHRERRNRKSEIQDCIGAVDMAIELAKKDGKQRTDLENADTLREYLGLVSRQLHSGAKKTQKNATRYDQHDWNVHHFNPEYQNLHTSVTGFGTMNVNWNQRERVHGGLMQLGIDPESFWHDIHGYLVQAGTAPMGQQREGEDTGTPEIPYTSARPGGGKTHGLKALDAEQSQIAYGHLGNGINTYLRKPHLYQSPAWYAMMANWWDIFQNASLYLRNQIGGKNFLEFGRVYNQWKSGKADEGVVQQAFIQMEKGAKKAGYNYAAMVYQLKRRMPMESLDVESESGETLGNLLSGEDNKISNAARQIIYNRKIRPADVTQAGDFTTGHDISVLKQIMSKEVAQEVKQAMGQESGVISTAVAQLGPEASSDEREMTKHIVDTGLTFQLYRHVFIWAHNQSGVPWTLPQANEFAFKAAQRHVAGRGGKQYGGEVTPSRKDSTAKIAMGQKEQEAALRKQMKLPAAARQQAPGTVLPQGEGEIDYQQQAEKLMKMAKIVSHPQTLRWVNPDDDQFRPEMRAAFEKVVQDRQLGYPIIAKVLKKVDAFKKDKKKKSFPKK